MAKRTTEEIYGCKKFWGNMTYDDALKVKIKLLNFELFEENRKHYLDRAPDKRNTIIRDLEHNESLLLN